MFIFSPSNQRVGMVLPVPEGCHTLSFAISAEIPTTLNVGQHLFCLPSQTNAANGFFFLFYPLFPYLPLHLSFYSELRNTNLFRNSADGETMVLSACFEEEINYVFCSIRFFRDQNIHFSFSTVAPVCIFRLFPFLSCDLQ